MKVTVETRLRSLKYWVDGTPEIRLLGLLCRSDRTSIDVGANIGQFTHWMERHSDSVVAFEPIPELADRLEEAFANSSVEIRRAAASATAGTAELAIPIGPQGERDAAASLEHDFADARRLVVATERIDDVVNTPVGFIKIDVEGHELDVLAGAQATLLRDRPALLVEVELRHHGGDIAEAISSICGSYDYSCHFLRGGSLHPYSDFRAEFQDEKLLGSPADYINNFIFLAR